MMFGYSWIKDPLWARYSHCGEQLLQHLLQSSLWVQKVFSFIHIPPLGHLHSAWLSGAASSLQRSLSSGLVKGAGAVFLSMCKFKK